MVNFPPLREHQRALYDHRQRFNVWVCHRRFGKTVLALYQLIADAYANTRPRPRYGYLAPLYRQGKVIAWDLLKHLTRQLPGTKINEAELRVDLTGDRRIQIFGADNPDALRGLYLDGAVFDEYGQMRPRVWSEVVRPALADREGWATFIGTPMGKNHFHDLYHGAEHDQTWHRALYTVKDTGVLPEDELASARNTMAPEQYAQEFECSFESALDRLVLRQLPRHRPRRRTASPACRGSPRRPCIPPGTSGSVTPRPSGFFSLSAACCT